MLINIKDGASAVTEVAEQPPAPDNDSPPIVSGKKRVEKEAENKTKQGPEGKDDTDRVEEDKEEEGDEVGGLSVSDDKTLLANLTLTNIISG